ncbi:MAG: aminotransferase class I/II-fold pyridoxal phosphate-dependent enzyme, partial [Candidatus Nanoarchaeia archaeon]
MQRKFAPLAEALNKDLQLQNNCAYEVLSERGRQIFFPSAGILGQSAEAKSSKINATIGTAFEEDGSPLCLECIEELVNLPSETFLYTPSFGDPRLRETWKKMLYDKNPSLKGAIFSQPVVCGALTHALSISGYLFVDEGDEIIIPDLNWDNYELVFQYAYGAKFATYETFSGNGYNVIGLENQLMAGGNKKIVLLNFPNNPTGYTATEKEAFEIKNSLLKAAEAGKKTVVILDDAYFGLVYQDGVFKESLFSLIANLHENILAVKLDAPTKEDYVWSFRIGFITFGIKNTSEKQLKALEAKAAGAIRGNVSNCSGIAQAMLLKAYQNERYAIEKKNKYEVLRKRYVKIREIFDAHPEYLNS